MPLFSFLFSLIFIFRLVVLKSHIVSKNRDCLTKCISEEGGRDGLTSGFVALRYGVGTLLIINNF